MKYRTLLGSLAMSLAVAGVAGAQAPMKMDKTDKKMEKHETMKQMKAEARITEKDARKTALAQVPGGWVKSGELEREGGKLLYSFDIKVKGKTGIDEVQVDALDGSVISNKHETPKEEKMEAKTEAMEKKSAMKDEKKEEKKEMKAAKKP